MTLCAKVRVGVGLLAVLASPADGVNIGQRNLAGVAELAAGVSPSPVVAAQAESHAGHMCHLR